MQDRVVDDSRIGGIDLATIEREVLMRHEAAYVDVEDETDLELGGQYQWRTRGERHLHNPDTISKLQHAARTNDYELYREYARLIDDAAEAPIAPILVERLGFSLRLAVPALILSVALSLVLGVIAATRPNGAVGCSLGLAWLFVVSFRLCQSGFTTKFTKITKKVEDPPDVGH